MNSTHSDSGNPGTLLPSLAVLASIISLTVGTSFGKQLFTSIGAEGTSSYRVAVSAVILLLIWRPWRTPLRFEDAKKIALYGITLGLMNLSFYLAIAHLPLGIAIAIEFTGPLTVALISSRRKMDFLWIALATVGLLLLIPINPSATDKPISLLGVGFALIAALLWALYIIFGKRVGHIPSGQSTSFGMLVASMVILPFGIARAGAELLNPIYYLNGTILAIASSAIPFTLEMYALQRLPKNTFGILCSMEPAVGAIAGLLILNEQLTLLQWLAIGCIVIASIGASMGSSSVTTDSEIASTIPADSL